MNDNRTPLSDLVSVGAHIDKGQIYATAVTDAAAILPYIRVNFDDLTLCLTPDAAERLIGTLQRALVAAPTAEAALFTECVRCSGDVTNPPVLDDEQSAWTGSSDVWCSQECKDNAAEAQAMAVTL